CGAAGPGAQTNGRGKRKKEGGECGRSSCRVGGVEQCQGILIILKYVSGTKKRTAGRVHRRRRQKGDATNKGVQTREYARKTTSSGRERRKRERVCVCSGGGSADEEDPGRSAFRVAEQRTPWWREAETGSEGR
ncbi:hypothetical protein MRX96_023502, partial [Rhipicephalus microplus]